MKSIALGLLLSAFVLAAATAQALAAPLVEARWVAANLESPNVVIVDVRGAWAYSRGHIPGAVHTDYGRAGWRVTQGGAPGMLPPVAALESLIGGLGIGNDSHVVLASEGFSAADMGKATRLYWTFKVLGHDEVSILQGGMAAYLADGRNPRDGTPVRPRAKTFKAQFRAGLLATIDDVRSALKSSALVDNRSADQYLGINKSGAVKSPGTIAGARNVPGVWLTENGGGIFRTSSALRELYALAGVPDTGAQITFCNTGHWASLGWFVASEILGNTEVRLYDGSMAEWSLDGANPVVRPAHAK